LQRSSDRGVEECAKMEPELYPRGRKKKHAERAPAARGRSPPPLRDKDTTAEPWKKENKIGETATPEKNRPVSRLETHFHHPEMGDTKEEKLPREGREKVASSRRPDEALRHQKRGPGKEGGEHLSLSEKGRQDHAALTKKKRNST